MQQKLFSQPFHILKQSQEQAEWDYAKSQLDDKPKGTILQASAKWKQNNLKVKSNRNKTFQVYQSTHSFIKIDKIYRLENTIGEGGCAKAKIATDEAGKMFVVKIQKDYFSIAEAEFLLLQKLGLSEGQVFSIDNRKCYTLMPFLGSPLCNKTITYEAIIYQDKPDFNALEKNKVYFYSVNNELFFVYKNFDKKIIKTNLSLTSNLTLADINPIDPIFLTNLTGLIFREITNDERLDLAIKTCLAVANFHALNYAHLDIKPGNLVINGNQIRLVDFGFTEEGVKNPPSFDANDERLGTYIYMPYKKSAEHTQLTAEQWDLLALKRTLFFPEFSYGYNGTSKVSYNFQKRFSILNETIMRKYALESFIDTSSLYYTGVDLDGEVTALSLAALLTAARQNVFYDYQNFYNHEFCKLLLAFYYENQKDYPVLFKDENLEHIPDDKKQETFDMLVIEATEISDARKACFVKKYRSFIINETNEDSFNKIFMNAENGEAVPFKPSSVSSNKVFSFQDAINLNAILVKLLGKEENLVSEESDNYSYETVDFEEEYEFSENSYSSDNSLATSSSGLGFFSVETAKQNTKNLSDFLDLDYDSNNETSNSSEDIDYDSSRESNLSYTKR